jgi:mono/diheme cytochrome c family protein
MKNNFLKTALIVIGGLFIFGALTGFKSFEGQKPWPVPDKYKNMKNPIKSDAASIATGKALWNTHCKSCHGSKGLGDGSKAAQLKTEPGNFSIPAFKSQTDGSIFYKTTEGRDDMPSFKKKIADDDDRWALVNFMRTL